MEVSIIRDPELTVAIDIGTTYSGYAFQWREDYKFKNKNIEFNQKWPLHKTKTCLLLDKDRHVDSIGSLAERRYYTEVDKDPDHIHGKWFFFEYFKDHLYCESRRDIKNFDLEDHVGQRMRLKDVLSLFIGALRDDFTTNLRQNHGKDCPENTLWVITVPALWPDKTKKFVREAAEKSGIKRQHLLLALEPECAALYCTNLPVEQRERMNHVGKIGDSFVTADAGGGTLDITAIKVREDGMLEEVCSVQGAQVGGNDVNNAFLQACTDVLDGDAWHMAFTEQNAMDLFTFLHEFEDKKVNMGDDERDEYISLPIPHSLRDMLKDGKVKLKPGYKYKEYFNTEAGKFQFKRKLVRNVLFKQVVDQLLSALRKVLDKEQLRDVRTLVLVGGFAQSNIVRETIRSVLKEKYPQLTVVVPTSPMMAVLMGAVPFGFNPLIFQSRIARATYGVKVSREFDPKHHKVEYKKKYKGDPTEYCQNIFSIHVHKDDSVILCAEQPPREYSPATPNSKTMAIRIFTSSEKNPVYTTDACCKELAKIIIQCPDTSKGRDRVILVTMKYGGTELNVIAKDKTTGKEYATDITFD